MTSDIDSLYDAIDSVSDMFVSTLGHLLTCIPPLDSSGEFSSDTLSSNVPIAEFLSTFSAKIVSEFQSVDELINKLPDPVPEAEILSLQADHDSRLAELNQLQEEAKLTASDTKSLLSKLSSELMNENAS
ncbi:hypothetical protein GEMRC1_005325 [Eukaryota sp. GEM-RC1]